jgi:8-oxo-dGTP pyrophosphatase MutT (NUDIX family)
VAAAAARELQEECGLVAGELAVGGLITARFRDTADRFELHIFRVTRVTGEIRETREMRPQWFAVSEIPYDQMWASDRLWLPLLLAGKPFAGTVWFDNLESRRLLKHVIKEVVHV